MFSTTMSTTFNPVLNSLCLRQAAINRLRSYKPPPFPLWDRLPIRMRAAVLILLYADRFGDLRVVITMRAASLRSFSGHAALPGGKADTIAESPCKSPFCRLLLLLCRPMSILLIHSCHRSNSKERSLGGNWSSHGRSQNPKALPH